jgi:hypothetical protein
MSVVPIPRVRLLRVVRDELGELVWLSLMIAAISALSVGLAAIIAVGLDTAWL